MNKTIWTDEKWEAAQRLKGEGRSYQEIATAIGFSSTQVKDKFWYARQSDDYRRRRYDRNNELRRAIRSKQHKFVRRPRVEPPAQPDWNTLIERNLRLATPPRDLTAAMMGDPRPGWSALERRA